MIDLVNMEVVATFVYCFGVVLWFVAAVSLFYHLCILVSSFFKKKKKK